MMKTLLSRALALALSLGTLAVPAPVWAATPAPHAAPKLVPHPPVPKVPLHAEFVVEVNAKGQVVRVKSAKGTGDKDKFFNAQTYGNVLQMWIRHPDGTAQVGLYRVWYDYNPKTRKVKRSIALLKPGGDWGNQQGAATQMIQTANREARDEAKRAGKSLPPLESIVGPTAPPTK